MPADNADGGDGGTACVHFGKIFTSFAWLWSQVARRSIAVSRLGGVIDFDIGHSCEAISEHLDGGEFSAKLFGKAEAEIQLGQ